MRRNYGNTENVVPPVRHRTSIDPQVQQQQQQREQRRRVLLARARCEVLLCTAGCRCAVGAYVLSLFPGKIRLPGFMRTFFYMKIF